MMVVSIVSDVLCREAAGDGSQGQARSAPPLDQPRKRVGRPEGARECRTLFSFLRTPSACAKPTRSVPRGGVGVPPSRALPAATFFHAFGVIVSCLLTLIASANSVEAQSRPYPKEIRGYKVERAAVELKSTAEAKKPSKTDAPVNPNQNGGINSTSRSTSGSSPGQPNPAPPATDPRIDQLITFGSPALARITPLGITFNLPVVVAPIKQGGHVDFLLFEDMAVNGHSVEIEEYKREFDLPTKKPLTLRDPLRFFIYTPVVALAAVDEWSNSKETWPVTGRVYVCGKYKKFLLKFKRCVPVELKLTMRNPLREK